MVDRNDICKACDGSGLLADDENWRYRCTVCGGDGIFRAGDCPEPDQHLSVDENNRNLD